MTAPTTRVTRDDATADDGFDALFRTHYERLVRTLTAVAGEREAAADAVQEAFVRAHLRWRRIGRYDDPIGWVRRVAINRLRDDHRRAGRHERALDRLASRRTVDVQPAEPDDGRAVDALLQRLPRQQRLVAAFFYVDGLSIAEVAETLGIAEGSVKSHLHDARQRLRRELETDATGGPRDDAAPRPGRGGPR
jgi:RNA polymerase sigma-70 factor (ECF subfamily)